MSPASHPRLEVYARALRAAVALEHVAAGIPEVRRDLRDQLRRASASIVLNLAEGADEFSAGDKARFYRMARRSAAECSAILDLLAALDPSAPPPTAAREALQPVLAMLTALVRAVEARARGR